MKSIIFSVLFALVAFASQAQNNIKDGVYEYQNPNDDRFMRIKIDSKGGEQKFFLNLGGSNVGNSDKNTYVPCVRVPEEDAEDYFVIREPQSYFTFRVKEKDDKSIDVFMAITQQYITFTKVSDVSLDKNSVEDKTNKLKNKKIPSLKKN